MDDAIIFSKDIDVQIHHVDELITKLGEAGVNRNLKMPLLQRFSRLPWSHNEALPTRNRPITHKVFEDAKTWTDRSVL